MSSSAGWISYAEARERMLSLCEPLGARKVHLDEALGRALAEDVRSRVDHPPWDNSAMDGFAVRAEDVRHAGPDHPVTLPVTEDVPAGAFPSGPLQAGTAARVMTGAPVPDGATGVIRVEHTDGGSGTRVEVRRSSDAERNVRRRGEDVRTGDLILSAGTEITPAGIGVLALAGHARVGVTRPPVIGVLATGDELADLDRVEEVVAGRKVMNSNSHALAAQLRTSGAKPVLLGIARDDRAEILSKLEEGLSLDGLITSAGVSVGDHDRVKEALAELGLERVFWRVRIRPGGPIAFGILAGKPLWALPGNPVSAMVTFEVFVRPAVRRLAGHRRLEHRAPARLGEAVVSKEGLTHFLRTRLEPSHDDLPVAYLTGPQGSGILTSMSTADALLIVPEGAAGFEPGDVADTITLGSTAGQSGFGIPRP